MFLQIVTLLWQFFFEAAAEFSGTEEGHARLEQILTLVEQAGVDVPFWSPEDGSSFYTILQDLADMAGGEPKSPNPDAVSQPVTRSRRHPVTGGQ